MSDTAKFLAALDEYATANHDVAFYADLLNLHPDYLTRLLKAETGRGAKQHITDWIAACATERLRRGASVRAVAGELGFDDPDYFSRFYRRATGRNARSVRSAQ